MVSIFLILLIIIFFVTLGVGIYFIYLLGKIIYTMLGIAEKGAKVVAFPITYRSRKKKEKMQEKMENFIKEKEEAEKEEKKNEED